uniref:Uncharacterized protein n=1 Tax=Tetranychus urticae TaxID=32264 RepID=T1KEK7_TETUR
MLFGQQSKYMYLKRNDGMSIWKWSDVRVIPAIITQMLIQHRTIIIDE